VRKVSLDEMWRIIEQYGINRDLLEMTGPTEEEIAHLYHLIKKRKHYGKEQEFIKLLKEYVEKMNRVKSNQSK
jgi:hypothetical protein